MIRWARQAQALVIEDDYDGEFRYDVRGLPALHSMTHGPDVVAYVGTASKILSPGLRIAWLIPPARLGEPVLRVLDATFDGINTTAGHALTHFIISGHLTSHLAGLPAPMQPAAARSSPRSAMSRPSATGHRRRCRTPPGRQTRHPAPAKPRRNSAFTNAGLAIDVLSQYATTAITQQALVCSYALLPETQARAAAAPDRLPHPSAHAASHGQALITYARNAAPVRKVSSPVTGSLTAINLRA